MVKGNSYDSLKALYYSGKVKPTLNKILIELEKDAENLPLTLLACQCLLRGKDYATLSEYADRCIKLDDQNSRGYYFKGSALQHIKGKEQEALKVFNEALTIEPENVVYLKENAITHLLLFKDYHLPINFAEKHRIKGEECLTKIITIVEEKESPTFLDLLTISDVSITINKNLDAKKYYAKAVTAFNNADEVDQDMNTFKDIVKGQKACIKLMEKFTE